MRAIRPSVVAAAMACALAAQDVDPGTSYLFALDQPTPAQRQLLGSQFDVLGACSGAAPASGPMQIVVLPGELAAFSAIAPGALLKARGRPFRDIARERAGPGSIDVPDPNYYTVAEIEAAIDAAVAAYPAIAQKVDLTALPGGVRTWENRSIFALKVSDNVALDEDEPAIVVAGQTHARELNAPVMVIGAMNRVLAAYGTDPALTALVDGHELWFVPMMNPDGVNHVWNVDNLWRKNRRNNGGGVFGVDNNRNYPFLWGLCGSSSATNNETYRGPSAASEPETQTMRNFIDRLRPELYLDFHSFGQDVLHLWAPCATVSPTWAGFDQRYVDDLRNPITYNFRAPSGSGEAPQDHWGGGGTLSCLVEVCTDFQPAFTVTQVEEARVWPGTQHALESWQPALRGHVRSSQLQPLAATVTIAPNQFAHGEVTKSRARDGRYALWLPLGTWTVTWSAPGFQSRSTTVTVSGYDQPQALEVQLDPVWTPPTLVKSGSERIGTVVTLTYTSPGDQGQLALMGWSLGTSPGIDLGGLRVLPLNADFLLQAALQGNPILAPTFAVLDGNAQTSSLLTIPNVSFAIGLTTWMAGITADPSYARLIKKWSAPVSVTPLP